MKSPELNLLEALGVIVVGVVFLALAERARLRRWAGASLIIIVYGAYLVIANIWFGVSSLFAPSPTRTPIPQPTITQRPAALTQFARPPTIAAQNSCLRWNQITTAMNGRDVCVYGVVLDYRENWENELSNFYFGARDEFFLVSNLRWTDPLEGKCVTANGEVQLNTFNVPYIKIDKLSSCEAWMR